LPAKNHHEPTRAEPAAAQAALALLADRWSFLLIRDAFSGVHRFGQFQRDLGIARNVLADRLSKLVECGLLKRVRYRTDPDWYEYRLTDRGRDLYPAILAFFRWVDTHYGNPRDPAVKIRHRTCGQPTQPLLVCSHCREPIDATEVELVK
jgi:DNA-binding HxlR family transcriptional regulator